MNYSSLDLQHVFHSYAVNELIAQIVPKVGSQIPTCLDQTLSFCPGEIEVAQKTDRFVDGSPSVDLQFVHHPRD